jgi:hypothetical protein
VGHREDVNAKSALQASIVGSLAMTGIEILFRGLRWVGVTREAILGSWIVQDISLGASILGFLIHVAIGFAFAVIYAMAFETLRRSGARWGLALAVPHVLVAGLLLVALPWVHPMIPAPIGARAAISFVVQHLAFGAILGALYKPRQAPETRPPARERTQTVEGGVRSGV